MLAETLIGTGAFATGGFVYAKSRRARLYRELTDRIAQVSQAHEPDWAAVGSDRLPDFADRLAVVPDFLPARGFAALAAEAERLAAPERSFVPTHKKGGTVAYETLIASAPAIVAFYHAADVQDFISRLVGVRVSGLVPVAVLIRVGFADWISAVVIGVSKPVVFGIGAWLKRHATKHFEP